MKKFYSIEKGQLVAMWIFGVIGSIISLVGGSYNENPLLILLAIIIIFFLVFYTIGWKKQNKKSTEELKNSIDEVVEKNKITGKKLIIFLKKKASIIIIILAIIIVLVLLYGNSSENNEGIGVNDPRTATCFGNINDLVFVENKYKTYNLKDSDFIGLKENSIKVYGLIKNNSTVCNVSNIQIKVIIENTKNSDIKQEETFIAFPSYLYESIPVQQTKEYNYDLGVFDTFIVKHSPYGFVDSSSLRNEINITTQIISAKWSNSY